MRKIKGLWKLLFGRTTLLVLLVLFQIAVLIGGFALLDKYIFIFNYILGFVSLVILLYILNARQNASFKLTWIMLILFAPFFGVIFYLFTRVQPGTLFIARRIESTLEAQRPYLAQSPELLRRLETESPETAGLARYIHDSGNYPAYENTQVKYFPLGEDKFREMVKQLKQAKEFIFMEYFIVDKGFMWDTVLEILAEKVKEGVEVRFMYDGTCSLSLLPPKYPEKMRELGIQCKVFAPIRPFLSTHQNNRDHRKVLVIDGRTAFTGGVNLADEYINEIQRFGHWKDTAVMVRGDAVRSFTLMFLQMWDIGEVNTPTPAENYMRYDFTPEPDLPCEGYVIPYGDSPYDTEYVGERVYMDILYNAKKYVHIMTPYLILDEEMITALTYAVKRGVEVIIMMPHIPDKIYAYLLARTYYGQLIDEGVQIYEYTPGFVHAKVFTSDDEKAVVGTINLDFRSLYLHFEDAVYIYKNAAVADAEADFQETLKKCQKITRQDCREYNSLKKILGRVLRLVAPLM
ncbi:cardiolipin synthase [Anaerovorax odorimutans]|uniref:Cardiolipin synthase n=1 Tax=Anaerovorax odorimutans TaxID=109327 RepID=A0ABT1RTD0_9FIRM|nr:cardiolipin synthase [Anaerovorax odorimutans]MCQ4638463.1 cardiolipin synthase [Anaerovorax odorimutans]